MDSVWWVPYVSYVLAFAGGLLALFGDPRRAKDKRWCRGLNLLGWISVGLISVGLVFSVVVTAGRQLHERQEARDAAQIKQKERYFAYLTLNNRLYDLTDAVRRYVDGNSADVVELDRAQIARLKDAVVQIGLIQGNLMEQDCRDYLAALGASPLFSESLDSNGVGRVTRNELLNYSRLCDGFSSWLRERASSELTSLEILVTISTAPRTKPTD